jgi:hypothetical protein
MDYQKKMMATWNTNPEAMKIEQDPGMMQSVEEHQEIPTEDAAVMPVGEPLIVRDPAEYVSHTLPEDGNRSNF